MIFFKIFSINTTKDTRPFKRNLNFIYCFFNRRSWLIFRYNITWAAKGEEKSSRYLSSFKNEILPRVPVVAIKSNPVVAHRERAYR